MNLTDLVRAREETAEGEQAKEAETAQLISDYMDVGAKLAEGLFGDGASTKEAQPVVQAASRGIQGIIRKVAPPAAAAAVAGGAGYATGMEGGREKEVMEQRRRTVLDRMFPPAPSGGTEFVIDEHSPWG